MLSIHTHLPTTIHPIILFSFFFRWFLFKFIYGHVPCVASRVPAHSKTTLTFFFFNSCFSVFVFFFFGKYHFNVWINNSRSSIHWVASHAVHPICWQTEEQSPIPCVSGNVCNLQIIMERAVLKLSGLIFLLFCTCHSFIGPSAVAYRNIIEKMVGHHQKLHHCQIGKWILSKAVGCQSSIPKRKWWVGLSSFKWRVIWHVRKSFELKCAQNQNSLIKSSTFKKCPKLLVLHAISIRDELSILPHSRIESQLLPNSICFSSVAEKLASILLVLCWNSEAFNFIDCTKDSFVMKEIYISPSLLIKLSLIENSSYHKFMFKKKN